MSLAAYYMNHMGHEAVPGHTATHDVSNRPPEGSPYAEISHEDLIVQFYESGADPVIGRELSGRLLTHAGFTGDPTTEPLTGSDGQPVFDATTRKPLMLVDYVPFAADHHLYALEGILSFLYTKPGEPEYESGRAAYAHYMDRNRSQAGKG